MTEREAFSFKSLSIRYSLVFFIVIIILIVIGFLVTISYIQARDDMINQNRYLEEYTEMNIIESLTLVDKGLKLYDDTLNGQMEDAFAEFIRAYENADGNPAAINLTDVRSAIYPMFQGQVDLYIINESGVIIESTVPEVLSLDFQKYPDFYHSITAIREGDIFSADRVVRSVTDTSSGTVSGELRKFAYMPTPDHRYLLELGLVTESFEAERSGLSYVDVAKKAVQLNPNVKSIRIFDFNRNLVIEGGVNPHGEVNRTILDQAFLERESRTVNEPDEDLTIRYLFVDLKSGSTASDMSLVAEITYSGELLQERLSQVLLFYLLIGLIAVGMGIALAYNFSNYLSRPISGIVEDADRIAHGDLDHPIRTMPNAEFEGLKNSITIMITRIREYSEELERERAELQIAADIQRTFLPRTIPGVPGFSLAARSIPAREVGGDFYDFIQLDGRRLGLVIADVAGKGIPAALFMALSRSIVRAMALTDHSIETSIEESNELISADAVSGMFVTLFYGVLDHETHLLSYVNAGHNPPLHYRAAEAEITPLLPTGMVLGVEPDEQYSVGSIRLNCGDLLVLYTDGVTEAINSVNKQFGEDRLIDIIHTNAGCTPEELLTIILDELTLFCEKMPQFDDITLVVLKTEK
jgi:serine phosphatase RsbU (regulator of sigma subunit)